MLKLYKRQRDGAVYWETWEHDGSHTIHWGRLGERGETKEVQKQNLVEEEIAARRSEGYSEQEDLATVVIQFKVTGWGDSKDLIRRHRIEEMMNECLGWTGLGHCDGGDIGSGTINIFCLVVDPRLAIRPITEELTLQGELEGTVIAAENEEGFEVLFPKDYVGDFGLL